MRAHAVRHLTDRGLAADLATYSCLALLLLTGGCRPTAVGVFQSGAESDATDPSPAGTPSTPGTHSAGTLHADLKAAIHHQFESIVVASWEQLSAAAGWVEFSFDDGVWLSTPRRQHDAGQTEELLLGIPYETEVQLRLVFDDGGGSERSDLVSITTGSLPDTHWRDWTVQQAQEDGIDAATPYFLLSLYHYDDRGGAAIIDRMGRLVWLRPTERLRCTLQAQPSVDGADLLIDVNSFYSIYDKGKASKVVRIKIDGTVLHTYDTVGLHHPFTQAPDGSIVWAATDGENETVESLSPSGVQRSLFSCDQISGELSGDDYCASNTIRWHQPTGTFLYSLYTHNAVLEVDPSSRGVVRVFGHQSEAYAFAPSDGGFWFQHGSHYTQDGTLMTSTHASRYDYELVVREYEVDDNARTLRLLWSFGEGEGVEGEEMGEAHRLPGGNVLHNYGSTPRLREVNRAGEVVWDVALSPGDRWEVGRSVPLSDLYAFAP